MPAKNCYHFISCMYKDQNIALCSHKKCGHYEKVKNFTDVQKLKIVVCSECAAENSGTQPTSTNSDYAAALKLYREFKRCFANPNMVAPFETWCEERLNAEEPHCA